MGAWIKTITLASYKGVLSLYSNISTGPYVSFHGSGGNLRFECSDVGSATRDLEWGASISGTGLIDDNWHHVFYTYDGNNVRSYKDGVYQNISVDWTYGCGNITDTLYIGKFWVGTFNGAIADVRIYDRALSAREVKMLYDKKQ